MMQKAEQIIDRVVELIGEDYSGCVGLRGLTDGQGVGDLGESYVWDDGNWTDESLGGTSTLLVSGSWAYDTPENVKRNLEKSIKLVSMYDTGNGIGIVIGETGEGGEDINELVIYDAKCICVL